MIRYNEKGYTLAGALALLAVMSILMALAVELWTFVKRRENEAELIFRGKEYVEAIQRYHTKFGTYPPDMETLEKLKYIRRLYPDPMTESGKWKVLHPDSLVQTGAAGQTTVRTGAGKDSDIRAGVEEEEEESRLQEDEESDEEPEVETTGPVVGVVSRSKKTSIKIYNNQTTYNKWIFVYALQQQPQQQPPQGRQGDQQRPGGKSDRERPGPGRQPTSGQQPPPGGNEDFGEDDDR